MVKKLIYFLVFILMLVGIAIYFRIEFKYMMVLNGQNTLILTKLKKAEKLTVDNVNVREKHMAYVAEENGVAFGADLLLYLKYLNRACKDDCVNREAYYKALDTILTQVNLKALWVYEQNKTKDRVAGFILEREVNVLSGALKALRKSIVIRYESLPSNELKTTANSIVSQIDLKIAEINEK